MRGAGGRGRTPRGRVLTAVLALAAGVLAPVATAPPAAALTDPVGFTADHLPTYQPNGIVWSLAEADGVVYAGGTFSTVRRAGTPSGGASTPAVNFAAFDAATGAPAGCSLSFTRSSGTATVRALAVSPDRSTLYVGGYFNAVDGSSANGLVAVDTATCIRRYAASHVHDCSTMGGFPNQARKHLTAQSVDDPALLGWLPDTNDGIGEPVGPRALAVSTRDGRDFLWVGGEFTTVNGVQQQALTRFANTPDTGAPSVPAAGVSAPRAGEVRVSWRSSLDLDDSLLTYRVYRNGGAAPVHTATGSSLFFSRPQLTFTDRNVAAGQSYSYRITATDGAGNTSALSPAVSVTAASAASPYQERVLADGANLYWRYDEPGGAFAADASGGLDGGVYVNAPTYRSTPSAVAGSAALSLNGSDEYVYSDRLHRYTSPTPYSIETWFRTTSTSGGRIVGFGNNIGTAQGHTSSVSDKLLHLTNNGRLAFGVQAGSTNSRPTLTSSGSFNDGRWHHAVATQGPGGMALYVDGVRVASNTTAGNRSYNGYWRVGGDAMNNAWPNRPSSPYFAGQVDETAIYPTALTAAQVAAHHQLAQAPAPPGDTTVSLLPTEDAYVNGVSPNVNYDDQQLASRGTTPYLSYLRFTLPAAPAGQVLKGARLQFRTSSDPTAGSTDSHTVVPVAGAWTESAVTYNSRPALSASVLGSITGATAVSTDYSVELTAPALGGALGSAYSLALTSGGTDSLRIWSSEAGSAAARPQLVLTFGAE
ncbi:MULTISPECIES: LamG-like jellyroll fold domain-containing protein [unclassified Streptomyces]|uniref:LamG-like jellyroll fold domain-containing protein n=1 Tax=unclassified Streptomyces TaxID=2593676 RepID=UPI00081F0E44|nr:MULTISPECIES: LamG-like jellyroll fold domain-containing protein [unclassified Streptomyces]MYR92481.1 DNRLRE domain-containing protein [Streptomyces sp. SID4937]SCD34550.1 Concanavalin A-like lectin/glucanases superfamily protein [Streptomyces sp. ScaeMP-e83]